MREDTAPTLDSDARLFQQTWTRLGLDQSDANLPTDATHKLSLDELDEVWRRWTRTLPRLTISEPEQALEHTDLEIIGELGEGGMGIVYLARQHSLQREVAVKRSRGDNLDPQIQQRMLHEARHTGTLEHPNIVPVHALGLDEHQRPVLVMKRIKGALWRDMLYDPDHAGWAEVKEAPLEWHLRVLVQVCNALHYAHSQDIVHRDLKPENIMIGDFGEVYVLDWGVALDLKRINEEKIGLVGTPAYMAPEMVQGEEGRVSAATDVFLLGACLHEIIKGAPPYSGGNLFNVLMSAMKATAPEFDETTPDELASICRRAMAPMPEARFETALEMRQALEVFLVHRSAIRLTQAAEARFEAIEALQKLQDPDDLELQRLFSACRFGLEQALEIWPENPTAIQNLRKTLLLQIEHALSQRDLKQAERLLAEVSDPDPSLAVRCEALRDELELNRVAQEDLAKLKADQDVKLHINKRFKMAIVQGPLVVIMSIGVTIAHTMGLFEVGHFEHTGLLALGSLLVLSGMWAMRREINIQTRNRLIISNIIMMLVTMMFGALFAWISGMSIEHTFGIDYIILAFGLAVGSINGDRFIFPVALCFFAAAFATALKPEWFILAGAVAVIVSHIILIPMMIWSNRRHALSNPSET